jgi:hypothetical protein
MKTRTVLLVIAVAALQIGAAVGQTPSDRRHQEMMPIHAQMLETQKAQDAEIDKLLATMNQATGEKRINAIVAVINKLVEQRKTMHAEMAAHLDR